MFGKGLLTLATEDPGSSRSQRRCRAAPARRFVAKALPDRFFDVGIAEGHAVTFAAGLATRGLRPVVAIYSTFLQRGFDNIIHDVAIQSLPVMFCMDRAGLVGEDGETHMGLYDIAYMLAVPNMTVTAPKNGAEMLALLRTAAAPRGGSVLSAVSPRGGARRHARHGDHRARYPSGPGKCCDTAPTWRFSPSGRWWTHPSPLPMRWRPKG